MYAAATQGVCDKWFIELALRAHFVQKYRNGDYDQRVEKYEYIV